eukprot:1140778-Pelagomonas_calceolata.AAC.7
MRAKSLRRGAREQHASPAFTFHYGRGRGPRGTGRNSVFSHFFPELKDGRKYDECVLQLLGCPAYPALASYARENKHGCGVSTDLSPGIGLLLVCARLRSCSGWPALMLPLRHGLS